MKKIGIYIFGILLFSFPGISSADLDCGEDNRICQCQKAWSQAFDAVTNSVINNEVGNLLGNNTVAPADTWNGSRAVSLKYSCLLGAVCEAVQKEGNEEKLSNTIFSPNNSEGGAYPGEFAACEAEISTSETLQKGIQEYKSILENISTSCNFSGEDSAPELRSNKTQMYMMCNQHRTLSQEIFNRTLESMMWKDTNRKISGYFSKKVTFLLGRIEEFRVEANHFVHTFNNAAGQLCTAPSS